MILGIFIGVVMTIIILFIFGIFSSIKNKKELLMLEHKKQEADKKYKRYAKKLVKLKKDLIEHERLGKNILNNANYSERRIIRRYKDEHHSRELSQEELYENRDILNQVDNWYNRLYDLDNRLNIMDRKIYDLADLTEYCYMLVPDRIRCLLKSCDKIIKRSNTLFRYNY